MSAVKATVRPIPTEQRKASAHSEQIKAGIAAELGRLHKTHVLLIATQFAANHECEFGASDAMVAIIERVEQHIETLDGLCSEPASNDRQTDHGASPSA